MEIFKYGSEILRKEVKEVDNIDEDLISLMDEMIENMILAPGIGLAGPQVGKDLRIFVMNAREGVFEKIINPKLISSEGVTVFNEGCLSFPKLFADISRPKKIKVSYLNEDGKEIIREEEGLWARCFLHELDHLDGKLFIDYLSKKQFRKSKQELLEIEKIGKTQKV